MRLIVAQLIAPLFIVAPILIPLLIFRFAFGFEGLTWWILFVATPWAARSTVLISSLMMGKWGRFPGTYLVGALVFLIWLIGDLRAGAFTESTRSAVQAVWMLFWVAISTPGVALFYLREGAIWPSVD